ncbi:MAG: thiamine pyrophosphate-binding protein [Dehalococcoidia bacterium]
MAKVDGGDLVMKALKREGVDLVFGLCGGPILELFRASATEGIRAIGVRHEQAAAFMAQAWSFVTGRPGVALAASGPGMINAITGLANAWANCWPMVLIGGSSPQAAHQRGAFQEAPQVEMARPVCKWAHQVEETRRIPEYLSIAFRMATSGRPGPVYLDLPGDVIQKQVELEEVRFPTDYRSDAKPLGDPRDVQRAAALLAEAQRPLLIVGKGVVWSEPYDELRRLVDTGLPFVTSPMGRGAIPDDHPMSFGAARSYALRQADVILAIGTRFNWIFHFGHPPRFDPEAKVIQVDIEPEEIGANRPAGVGIVGDARMVLQQLLSELEGRTLTTDESPWLAALRAQRQENEEAIEPLLNADDVPMNHHRMLREIRDFLDRDAIVVDDGQASMAAARQVMPTYYPAHRLNSGTFGCVGVGVPFAIAAKLAHPQKQVISISGDCAFGFNALELETAVRAKAPVVFVVDNNDGIVGSHLQDHYLPPGWEPVATYIPGIRYDRIIEAFGGHAEHVERPEEMRPALERAFAAGVPACINVAIDPKAGRYRPRMMQYE